MLILHHNQSSNLNYAPTQGDDTGDALTIILWKIKFLLLRGTVEHTLQDASRKANLGNKRVKVVDGTSSRTWSKFYNEEELGILADQINLDNKSVNDTSTAELERYKEQVKVLKEGQNVDLKSKDNVSDSCAQFKRLQDILRVTAAQYLTHTDYALWEVIVNGDAPAIASASAGTEGPIPPKTAEQKLARKNELKAKSTLLLAIPDEHLLKFHGIKDAKDL
ncbi:hypothetical protein Tco_0630177 [Tanacetum coccineum]